jgi:hypothetical protein
MVIDAVRENDDPLYLSTQHKKEIRALEIRLEGLKQERRVSNHCSSPYTGTQESDRVSGMAELYRLAALIYLKRVAGGVSVDDTLSWSKVQSWVEEALDLLKDTVKTCERPFPLFVIALEARTDDQRHLVLQVIDNTIKERVFSTLPSLWRMVEAAWVQDDLEELNALLKYHAVISANRVPPAFT